MWDFSWSHELPQRFRSAYLKHNKPPLLFILFFVSLGECQKVLHCTGRCHSAHIVKKLDQNVNTVQIVSSSQCSVPSIYLCPSAHPPLPSKGSLLNNPSLLETAGLVTMAANSQSFSLCHVCICTRSHTRLALMWEGCPWVQLGNSSPVKRIPMLTREDAMPHMHPVIG